MSDQITKKLQSLKAMESKNSNFGKVVSFSNFGKKIHSNGRKYFYFSGKRENSDRNVLLFNSLNCLDENSGNVDLNKFSSEQLDLIAVEVKEKLEQGISFDFSQIVNTFSASLKKK